jgi:hypothetical protein
VDGGGLPLRDALQPAVEPGAAPDEVPDLDLSEEVFSEPPPGADEPPAEPAAEEPPASGEAEAGSDDER